MTVIETERLILRQALEMDGAALLDVFGDKEVMRYGEATRDEACVKTWIHNMQLGYQTRGYANWLVVSKQDAAVLGYCGLDYAADLGGCQEIALGYRLARAHWGRGYATEAVKATLAYGLTVLELSSIVATIDPSNVASIRVAEKAGMVYEKEILLDWYTHPDYLYRIRKYAQH